MVWLYKSSSLCAPIKYSEWLAHYNLLPVQFAPEEATVPELNSAFYWLFSFHNPKDDFIFTSNDFNYIQIFISTVAKLAGT